jgi:hypothetical protein
LIHSYTVHIQPINSHHRSSVSIEEIRDDDDLPPNIAPRNESHILELSDGSEDELEDDCPALIDIDDDDDDEDDDNGEDDDDGDKTEEPEESAEAELGQLLYADVYTILTSP